MQPTMFPETFSEHEARLARAAEAARLLHGVGREAGSSRFRTLVGHALVNAGSRLLPHEGPRVHLP